MDNFTDELFLVTIDKLAVCTIDYCDGNVMTSQKKFGGDSNASFGPLHLPAGSYCSYAPKFTLHCYLTSKHSLIIQEHVLRICTVSHACKCMMVQFICS